MFWWCCGGLGGVVFGGVFLVLGCRVVVFVVGCQREVSGRVVYKCWAKSCVEQCWEEWRRAVLGRVA